MLRTITPKLEEIVDAVEECSPRADFTLYFAGLYDPEEPAIFYNPSRIEDVKDFYVTIVHEACHHIDDEDLYENEIELSAIKLIENQNLIDYLGMTFEYVIERYWGK